VLVWHSNSTQKLASLSGFNTIVIDSSTGAYVLLDHSVQLAEILQMSVWSVQCWGGIIKLARCWSEVDKCRRVVQHVVLRTRPSQRGDDCWLRRRPVATQVLLTRHCQYTCNDSVLLIRRGFTWGGGNYPPNLSLAPPPNVGYSSSMQ